MLQIVIYKKLNFWEEYTPLPQLPHYMLQYICFPIRCFKMFHSILSSFALPVVVPLLHICYGLKQQLRITQKLQRNLEMAIYFCYDVKGKMTIGH